MYRVFFPILVKFYFCLKIKLFVQNFFIFEYCSPRILQALYRHPFKVKLRDIIDDK